MSSTAATTFAAAWAAFGSKVHTAVNMHSADGVPFTVLQCGTGLTYQMTVGDPMDLTDVAAAVTCTKCAGRTAEVLARRQIAAVR